jgi:hypothetical protein
MDKVKTYDNFPLGMVVLPNLVAILIYLAGVLIMYKLSLIAAILFLIYAVGLELRLLSRHCVNCYYYGKVCGFGKGRISSLFFKAGDPLKFCEKSFKWKDMIPDLLITLIPLVTGLILVVFKFSILLLICILLLIGLTTMGNSVVRGSITCKFCKQRELGCPAEKLFSKKE